MKIYKPLQVRSWFSGIIGERITHIRRYVFIDDLDAGLSCEEADGAVELTFSNHEILHFVSWTEEWSVGVGKGVMPAYGDSYLLKDLTNDDPWKRYSHLRIENVAILVAGEELSEQCDNQYGIKFSFENKELFAIEYVSSESVLDSLRISRNIDAPDDEHIYLKI